MDPKEEIKLTQDALFVLCYFAFQTVAEIVDYALYVREDRQAGKVYLCFVQTLIHQNVLIFAHTITGDDPLKHLPGSYYTATMFNAPHGLDKRRIDCTRVYFF